MITKDVRSLLEKLNEHTTLMFHAAAGFSISRTHYEVAIEHLLLKLLEEGSGDIPLILDHFDIEKGQVWKELNKTLEGFRTGKAGNPTPSPALLQLIESAWVAITLHHQQNRIRSGAILEVMLDMDSFQLGEYMETLSDISLLARLRTHR